jgi:hypothetical protein
VYAADDSGTRAQSHRNTERTDHFGKHCGNVVGRVCIATSKQAGRVSYAALKSETVYDMTVELSEIGMSIGVQEGFRVLMLLRVNFGSANV